MVARLADEFENIDFHTRSRYAMTVAPVLYSVVAFIVVIFVSLLMGDIHNKPLFVLMISLVMTSLGVMLMFLADQTRDLVMVTEFQNALLSSAVQMNMRFCLIVEHTGSIAYMDRGFQTFFPHSAHNNIRNIQGVFSSIGATAEAEELINQAMTNNRSERIVATLQDAQGQSMPLMIMVDVLPRPRGFFLIRARDYVTKRKISGNETESVNSTMFSRTLDALPQGALITRANGAVVYANRVLEEWLGYKEGELLASSMSLPNLIYQYGEDQVGQIIMDNYTGDITLRHKDHSLLRLYVHQVSIHEDNVKMGVSATFHLVNK